jgi:hypothetical protein
MQNKVIIERAAVLIQDNIVNAATRGSTERLEDSDTGMKLFILLS